MNTNNQHTSNHNEVKYDSPLLSDTCSVQEAITESNTLNMEEQLDRTVQDLQDLGFDEAWSSTWESWIQELQESTARRYASQLVPARVALAHKHLYRVVSADGEWLAELSGQARAGMALLSDWPTVGDWVAVAPRQAEGRATIVGVLPRRSTFGRKVAGGRRDTQIVAANADIALLVTSMSRDFEPRRLERYAALAWDSGAMPAVVLTKADEADDPELFEAQAMQAVPGVDVYRVSAMTGEGMDELRARIAPGMTVVLVGSSGVGKSTLANALTGTEQMLTQAARSDDDRGRHTTTHRELLRLQGGAWLIDTPGMREVGMTAIDSEGLSNTFEDIESLAEQCRFSDCKHEREPGCAVREAIRTGELDSNRLRGYQKLQREIAYMRRSENAQLARQHVQNNKKLSKLSSRPNKRK
ncbi:MULTISPECIES: ribosome small subunit-dependent GTPase A [Paenibacillus]|uniref:Small ribosomal subunit biogenesis GTPase RsgA n=2 Tax=Paenibacillus alvei TaxID=44250 RepID=A0ABT4EEZ0_PAEAL|nr:MULTISPECIES: ribosome small subunit-dependent GTPase A [Paenibacillus]EPY12202.1 GTPase RsgA [Paenibacillus alvei A6-6i-x]MCY9532309.1 ribosome small subunit-dependent GTPase A [Paenibacillus alvei]SDE46544.1 ribosome biogenesis GTPase [Paenibacillus sp. cl6col]